MATKEKVAKKPNLTDAQLFFDVGVRVTYG